MTDLRDGTGSSILHLAYDRAGRAVTVTLPHREVFHFNYTALNDNGRTALATVLTLPSGQDRTFVF